MAEKILAQGNEAVGWGALAAGCLSFFGYPITPQSEITEWFAAELPKREGVFLQSHSEVASINMLYGAAATGVRALTSTSSPGWALMQEGMSQMANAQLPGVIVLVMRGGPGQGTTQHAQTDYTSATRGGGHGGYKNIVLAPASVQETHDLTQLAFHLADKYRNPVILLSDAIVGQTAEPLEIKGLDFGPLPEKDWAVRGKGHSSDGERRIAICGWGAISIDPYPDYLTLMRDLDRKFKDMTANEVRYETYQTEDAELLMVAYGSCARICREALEMARAEGMKVGLIRPITVWPFPTQVIRDHAGRARHVLVVEDSLGQMLDDAEFAVQGKATVHFIGMLDRHMPTGAGMILPERVLREVREILGRG